MVPARHRVASVAATSASRSRRKRRRQALMKACCALGLGRALGGFHGLVDQRERV
jgi:hypothetical protein